MFYQALLGRSILFNPTPSYELRSLAASNVQECLQLFNLSCTVMQCSNLISRKLRFVHEVIFVDDNMYWHLPEYEDSAVVPRRYE
jgi:hypothetical protein